MANGLSFELIDLFHPVRSVQLYKLRRRVMSTLKLEDIFTVMEMLTKFDLSRQKDVSVADIEAFHGWESNRRLFGPIMLVFFDPVNRWRAVEVMKWVIKRFDITEDEVHAIFAECDERLTKDDRELMINVGEVLLKSLG